MVYFLSDNEALSTFWRLTSFLLRDRFTSYLTSELKIFLSINSIPLTDPSTLWETCKSYCRGLIISFMASRNRQRTKHVQLLQCNLAELEKKYLSAPRSDIVDDLTATRAALNNLLFHKAEYSLKFARQRLYESGDKPGKYLANLVKRRSASQTIVSVVGTSGIRYLDTKSINSKFAQFYSNLYSSEQPDDASDLMHSFFLRSDTVF